MYSFLQFSSGEGPWLLSRYIGSLRDRRSWGWIPVGGEIFRTGPGGPTSLLYNGYRVFCPEVNRPGRDVDKPIPSGAKLKERVELNFFLLPLWTFTDSYKFTDLTMLNFFEIIFRWLLGGNTQLFTCTIHSKWILLYADFAIVAPVVNYQSQSNKKLTS